MNSSIFNFRAWRMAMAVIAFFLLMEAIFRISYFGPDSVYAFWRYSPEPITSSDFVVPDTSPRLGYRLASGQSGYYKGAPFKTNSHGFRGEEAAIEKAHDVFRIAVLGSSVTMGSGVSNQQTWPAQLQELLFLFHQNLQHRQQWCTSSHIFCLDKFFCKHFDTLK